MSTFDPMVGAEAEKATCRHAASTRSLRPPSLQRAFSAGLSAGLERAEAVAREKGAYWDASVPGLAVIDQEEGAAAHWFAHTCNEVANAIASERERTRGTPG